MSKHAKLHWGRPKVGAEERRWSGRGGEERRRGGEEGRRRGGGGEEEQEGAWRGEGEERRKRGGREGGLSGAGLRCELPSPQAAQQRWREQRRRWEQGSLEP
eukprot:2541705-Rhodomonas_salina.3